MKPSKETYPEAQLRLFRELSELGAEVKPGLKVPQVKLIHLLGNGVTLCFRKRAVYLEAHSLWIDIRGLSVHEFLGCVVQAKRIRALAADASICGHASHVMVRATKVEAVDLAVLYPNRKQG